MPAPRSNGFSKRSITASVCTRPWVTAHRSSSNSRCLPLLLPPLQKWCRREKNEGALRMRFFRHTESIGPICHHFFYPWAASRFPVGPVPGYRTRRKEHALPIVRDEFRPAIPRRVARQHCPSPLHRHAHPKSVPGSGTMNLQRTVNSVLTVCLSIRYKPNTCL